MLNHILEYKKTDRPWHLPLLAGLCIGVPILSGFFTGHFQEGKLASMAALVILYLQSNDLPQRMIILMTCCFGIVLSFALGVIFSFNGLVAPIILGLYAFGINYVLHQLRLSHPPGNFFFIMIASIAICMPFQPEKIAEKIGYISIGTMISCSLGFIYSLMVIQQDKRKSFVITQKKDRYQTLIESLTIGAFIGFSLLVARLLHAENAYWIPTSCAAVMQGTTTKHVFTRSLQRILGTFIGLGLAWLIFLLKPSLLAVSIIIIACQVIVEFIIVPNYMLAAVFITALSMLLAEPNTQLTANIDKLFAARFFDILTGSSIGCIGGWVLYNEKVHYYTRRQVRLTNRALRKSERNKTNA